MFKLSNSSIDFEYFAKLRPQCKSLRAINYSSYLANVQNSIKHDSKYFWSFFKDKKPNNSLPNTMFLDDQIAENNQSIVNSFA